MVGRERPAGNQSHSTHLRPSNMSLIRIRVFDNRTLAHGAVASANRDETVIAGIGAYYVVESLLGTFLAIADGVPRWRDRVSPAEGMFRKYVTKAMLATQRREKSIPGTVLVVGADPTFRVLARSAFQRDGHDVVLAATGEDGCRVFDDRVPDLVVMDVGLPVVDGYEACERFRTRGTGAPTPVLMLTGSDDADTISKRSQ